MTAQLQTQPETTPEIRRFQRMQELDKKMRESEILASLGTDPETRRRGVAEYNRTKQELGAIVGTMEVEEMVRYREFFLANPFTPAFV